MAPDFLKNMRRNMKRRMKVKPAGLTSGSSKRFKLKGFGDGPSGKGMSFGGKKGF
jgi:hypothetical protein